MVVSVVEVSLCSFEVMVEHLFSSLRKRNSSARKIIAYQQSVTTGPNAILGPLVLYESGGLQISKREKLLILMIVVLIGFVALSLLGVD